MSSKLIEQLESEYIKLHSQIMNSSNPTAEQWARLDEIGKEILMAKIGADEKEILRVLKEKGINQYDESPVSVELYPSEKVAGKKLESLGLVVLDEYGNTGRSFFLATLTDEGIVFVNEMLED